MSTATDKAFASGLSTAAQLARAAAARALNAGVGAKWQGAHAALDALADDLDALARPAEPSTPATTPENPNG